MVTDNTEAGGSLVYDPVGKKIGISVEEQTEENFTTVLKTKLDGIEAGADVTDTANVVAALTAGTNIEILATGQINATDTTRSDAEIQAIAGGMADAGSHTGGTLEYDPLAEAINLTVNSQTDNNFTDALKTKLDGIEAGADVTDTENVVAALTAGTNVQIAADGTISATDTKRSEAEIKDWAGELFTANTESGATLTYDSLTKKVNFDIDEDFVKDFIGASVEGGANTNINVEYDPLSKVVNFQAASQTDNNFTDAYKTKLDNIEANADVTDTENVVAALTAGANVQIAADGTISSTDTTRSDEEIEDVAGGMFAGNTEYIGRLTYDDATGKVNFGIENDEFKDLVGDMAGNVADDGGTITYDLLSKKLLLSVDSQTDNNFTNALKTKLDNIEANADVTDTDNVVAALTAGANITIQADGTISSSYVNTQRTDEEIRDVAGAMVNHTGHIGGYLNYDDVNDQIVLGVTSQTDNNFTNALKLKLDGIEAGADVTDTTNVVAALTEGTNITIAANGTVSGLSDDAIKDLAGALVASGTQSGITVTYDTTNRVYDFSVALQSSNDFTNAFKTKLEGIEAGADITDTANVVAALTAGTNVTIAVDGTISSTDTNTQRTNEEIQDQAASLFQIGSHSGLDFTYQDSLNRMDVAIQDSYVFDRMRAVTYVTKDALNEIDIDLSVDTVNYHATVSGTYHIIFTNLADAIGQSGLVYIDNTAATTASIDGVVVKTPLGQAINFDNSAGAIGILSYYVANSTSVLVNYVGSFS